MKQLLLICAVVVLVGCGKKEAPDPPIAETLVEKAVRKSIKKPTGELTKADLEKVKVLNLSGNQLTDVKGLEKLNQLTWLYLDYNQLTDVKDLERLTNLKLLNLNNNQLTDVKGLEKLTQLTELYLDGNQLTEVPEGLEKLTKLEKLSLQHNPSLTKVQIDELKKALPNCEIYSDPDK